MIVGYVSLLGIRRSFTSIIAADTATAPATALTNWAELITDAYSFLTGAYVHQIQPVNRQLIRDATLAVTVDSAVPITVARLFDPSTMAAKTVLRTKAYSSRS
jgi:hypothetical protein